MDNGSPFISDQLVRICAVLGIRLVHSRPGKPQGRGKIERFFRTVRDQFLVEIDDNQIKDLADLNRLFTAWLERRYHRRIHRETGQSPLDRFDGANLGVMPTPALLAEAFQWAADRTVTKTAMISLHGNRYEVDPALVGRKVQVTFDPFDLATLDVAWNGQPFGTAVPHELKVHVHPRAVADVADPNDGMSSGIDYLTIVAAEQDRATRGAMNVFRDLPRDNPNWEGGR